MGTPHEPGRPGHSDLRLPLPRVTPADLLVGAALVMLLCFSFADAWFRPVYADGHAATVGNMWTGLGLLTSLFLVAAIVYWVLTTFFTGLLHISEPPIPPARMWLLFGAMETALVVMFFVTEGVKDWDQSGSRGFTLSIARTIAPGWAWYGGVVSAALISLAGLLKMREGSRLAPRQPPASPPAPDTQESYDPPAAGPATVAEPLRPMPSPPPRDPTSLS